MTSINIENLTSGDLVNGPAIRIGYYTAYYSAHPTNCKLCSIDGVGQLCNDEGIKGLKKILTASKKLAFNVELHSETYVEYLKKHFKVINISKIPIGYGGGFQYHCCFLTENTGYSGYPGYLERIEKANKVIDTPKLVTVDSIDSIFASLKNITEQDLQKIKSYKQPKRAKDLLKSILIKE